MSPARCLVAGLLLAAAVPAGPATACSPSLPAPPLRLSASRVAPGATLRVAGEASPLVNYCPTPGPRPPRPSPEPSAEPSPEPSSSLPVVAPSLVPVHHVRPADAELALFVPGMVDAWQHRRVVARFRVVGDRFELTVRVPADVRPGRYELSVLYAPFGQAPLEVVAALPDTGRDTAPLVRLAAGLLAAGVGALALARRQPPLRDPLA